jgi:3-oxoadipate enol-lactonase
LSQERSPTPALLLHGQPGAARDWNRVVAVAGRRFEPIVFDRPGWDGVRSPTDLAGNGAAAGAVMDAHRVERATIVGHSFGGAVACWLAAEHPERVSALVLAAPAANCASLSAVDRWLAAPVIGDVFSSLLGAAGRALSRPAAWRAFAIEQRALIRDLPSLESRLGSITVRTTILIGTRDRIVPFASARRLAEQIPGASVNVLEGAGHLLPLHHAPEVAAAIAGVG